MQKLHNASVTHLPAGTEMCSKVTRRAQLIGRSIKILGLTVIAASTTFIASSYGQRAGNQFDPEVQKRILREYAGPTALCEPLRLLPGFICSEKFPEYAVSIQGTAETMIAGWAPFRPGAGADIWMPRLVKFAGHFGFSRDETIACKEKAVLRAQNSVGHEEEKIANANYRMVCRGWKEAVELVITLTPKSSF